MARLRDISFQIAEQYNQQRDEEHLSALDQIVNQWRTKVFKQAIERRGMDRQWLQSFDIELVPDDIIASCDRNGCQMLRTKCKIPKAIMFKGRRSPYEYVGVIDKSGQVGMSNPALTYIQPHLFYLREFNEITPDRLYYTIERGYIFVYGSKYLKRINISAIFEEPLSDSNFCNCINCDSDENTEGNIFLPQDLIEDVKRGVRSTNPSKRDDIIDGTDDSEERVSNNR